MANQKDDVIDILDKATTGWITPPTQPLFVIETAENPLSGYFEECPTNGVIVIKKDIEYTPTKLCPTTENRLVIINCVIISRTDDNLELLYKQMKEVFDRYTAAPWSTATLGTGTTYRETWVTRGKQDVRLAKFALDVTVYLLEQFVDVIIA